MASRLDVNQSNNAHSSLPNFSLLPPPLHTRNPGGKIIVGVSRIPNIGVIHAGGDNQQPRSSLNPLNPKPISRNRGNP